MDYEWFLSGTRVDTPLISNWLTAKLIDLTFIPNWLTGRMVDVPKVPIGVCVNTKSQISWISIFCSFAGMGNPANDYGFSIFAKRLYLQGLFTRVINGFLCRTVVDNHLIFMSKWLTARTIDHPKVPIGLFAAMGNPRKYTWIPIYAVSQRRGIPK